MTATPDSFSTAELAKLLENAPQDITAREPESDNRQERLVNIAQDALSAITAPLNGGDAAQVHKIILHMLVDHMIEWHSTVSAHAIRDGEPGAGLDGHAMLESSKQLLTSSAPLKLVMMISCIVK